MGLFEWIFPQVSQADSLKALHKAQLAAIKDQSTAERHAEITMDVTTQALKMRIDAMEDDLGFALLLITGILAKLEENGNITREELRAELEELDSVDGVKDSKITSKIVRFYLNSGS